MESVGSQLRQARLSRGVSFEQISAKTRISLKNLQAIENDDLSGISSPFFYRSFVKQFAEQLKVDYNSLEPAVGEAVGALPEPRVPGQASPEYAEAPLPKLPRLKMRGPKNLRWLVSLLSFGLMLAACSTFYGAWQQSRSNWHALAAVVSFFTPGTRATHMTPIQQSIAPFAPDLGDSVASVPTHPAAAVPKAALAPAVIVAQPQPAPNTESTSKPVEPSAPAAHNKTRKHSRRHHSRHTKAA